MSLRAPIPYCRQVVRCGQGRLSLRTAVIELANKSPADPRPLILAASDSAAERPELAFAAEMTGLRSIANGWGYNITCAGVLDAYAAVMAAARAAGVDEIVVEADVRAIIAASLGGGEWLEMYWNASYDLE